MHLLKPHDSYEWEYLLLALDVKGWSNGLHIADNMLTLLGHTRIVLERRTEKNPLSLLGVRWR